MKRVTMLFCIAAMLFCAVSAYASAPYRAELPDGEALITDAGVFVVEPGTYQDILVIEPGKIYLVGTAGNYRIIDKNGKDISDIEVSMARYDDDMIFFGKDGLYGAMDIQGNIVVEPVWTQLVGNGSGGFIALGDSTYDNVADEIIYIGADGVAVPTGNNTVGMLEDISGNRMPYMTTHGSYGYVNEIGMAVTEPLWLYAGSFENGTAVVADGNGMGLVDIDGANILPCSYTQIDRNSHLVAALSQDGMLEVYLPDGKRKLFSTDANGCSFSIVGNCVVLTGNDCARIFAQDGRCIYTGSSNAAFSEGLNGQIIVSDGRWGESCVWLMDQNGKAVSEKYQQIMPLDGNRYAFITMRGAVYFSEELNDFQRSWNYESIRYGMIDGEGREILSPEYLEILTVEDDRFILVKEDGTHLADESGNIIKSWLLPEEEDTMHG